MQVLLSDDDICNDVRDQIIKMERISLTSLTSSHFCA